jgi:hypothetical protein
MLAQTRFLKAFAAALVLAASLAPQAFGQQKAAPAGRAVAWQNPGDIAARDLRYGPGSAELAPAAPFTFVKEDSAGESPKFQVRDARGVTWSVKLGVEAQAETVCSRVLWALGYFADEAYHLESAEVQSLPRLSRGQEFVAGNVVRGARFEPRRDGVERGDNWDWEQNPFAGTRELNGLKVLMVLLGNYDTSVRNNQIYAVQNAGGGEAELRYVVSDVGATLGKVGGLGGKRSKNSLADFAAAKFVTGVENGIVRFDYSTKPKGLGFFASVFSPGYAKSQAKKERAMRSAPLEDARWIGSLLARLSDEQLRDAFRAAHYDAATTEGYVKALRGRIDQLTQLPAAAVAANQRATGK